MGSRTTADADPSAASAGVSANVDPRVESDSECELSTEMLAAPMVPVQREMDADCPWAGQVGSFQGRGTQGPAGKWPELQ